MPMAFETAEFLISFLVIMVSYSIFKVVITILTWWKQKS